MFVKLSFETGSYNNIKKIILNLNKIFLYNPNVNFSLLKKMPIKKLKRTLLTSPNADKTSGQEAYQVFFYKTFIFLKIKNGIEFNKIVFKLSLANTKVEIKFFN